MNIPVVMVLMTESEEKQLMGKVIGIDLGTTNSCVSVLEGGEPVVIPNVEGERITPSVFAMTKSGERLVGTVAKRQAITNPVNTVFSIKRFMGRKFRDIEIEQAQHTLPYKLVEADNGDLHVEIQDRTYSPPEISALVLQKMKHTAEDYLGEPVTEAVITVPAYFNDSQRQATKDAGRIAGLDVKRIINEPTAASLAYGFGPDAKKKGDKNIAVYDLGGGSFDISILEIGDDIVEVKSTHGDTYLGGDDFDQAIINYLIEEFKEEKGIDLSQNCMALQRLKEAAEKAKCELSSITQIEVNLPFITTHVTKPRDLIITLTRAKYEQLVDDLIERTKTPCRKALEDAGLTAKAIDEVLLVGDMTRMPKVQETVKEIFGREPNKSVHPDEVVALGAAIQGGVLKGEVRDVLLLDVTSLSLGIETLGRVFTRLIERNTTIPCKKSQIFSTANNNQSAVSIKVFQGERQMALDNILLSQFDLVGIPPAPRGIPQIEVSFDIDADGIMHVSAKDLGTGREQSIKITASSGLSKDEVDRMVKEAKILEVKDKKKREEIELRNNADNLCYQAEKHLKEFGDKVDSEVNNRIDGSVQRVRQELEKKDNKAELESAYHELEENLQKLGEAVYQAAGAGFAGGAGVGQAEEETAGPGAGGERDIPIPTVPSPSAITDVVINLKNPDSGIKIDAIGRLESYGNENFYQYIVPLLMSKNKKVRNRASQFFRDYGRNKTFILLKKMVEARKSWKRRSAVHALRYFNTDESIKLLISRLQDNVKSVREKASQSLNKLAQKGKR